MRFADLSAWRKIAVTGSDALEWLNDLISADVSGLTSGSSRRSLLLSPTGRIRAEFTVARLDAETLLLIQDPEQPDAIDQLLDRYVLSSDVSMADRTDELMLFAFPDVDGDLEGTWSAGTILRPSVLGSGLDVLSDAPLTVAGTHELQSLSSEEIEERRILRGVPKYGVDASGDDLPQEGGFTDAVSFGKGCYLGQEAVAKVQNLGHPRRVLLALEAAGVVVAGDVLEQDGAEVGWITSAAGDDERTSALATVKWAYREGPFHTKNGAELHARPRQ